MFWGHVEVGLSSSTNFVCLAHVPEDKPCLSSSLDPVPRDGIATGMGYFSEV